MKAYVLIKIRAGEVKVVVGQLRKLEQVIEAHMTFGPFDAVVVLTAKDLNELGVMIASDIQPIPGVMETLTCVAVDV
ncbi:MAG TPA: Lrp/AsnC ligand binding domain-containing protein [Anaerolineales bacterium]|nr:Lrp/AsnC ligand binding domain-containing protein [Anaerolineales bacterium]